MKIKKKKTHNRHISIGSLLIASGSLCLVLFVFTAIHATSPVQPTVLGSAINPTTSPLAYEGGSNFQSGDNTYQNDTNTFGTKQKTSGDNPYAFPTPTPTAAPLDESSVQQIIQMIDQQFNQNTQYPTPIQTSGQQSNGTLQPNSSNTNTSQTNTNTTSNTGTNSMPVQNSNNSFQQTDNSGQSNNSQGNSGSEQTFLPSNSIQTTQQTLNNALKDQNIHVKIENQGGQTVITATNDQGKVVQVSNDLVNKLTDLLTQDTFPKIVKVNASEYLFKKGDAVAQTQFPLRFQSGDNVPLMTVGTNDIPLSVLPDQVVTRMQTTDLLKTIGNTSLFTYMFPAYTPPPSIINMNLTMVDNQPVYAISGTAEKKLFGLLPIAIPRTVLISAQTGIIQGVQEGTLSNILEKLSQ